MSTQVYRDGTLVESWDDATRTYTDHRTDPPTVRDYTVEENEQADAQMSDAATLSDLSERVAALEAWRASLEQVDPETDPTNVADWPSGSDYLTAAQAILPGALVRFPAGDGLVYRNGHTLPLVHSPALIPPESYPHLWVHVPTTHDPEPEPTRSPWSPASVAYAMGDEVTYEGRAYRCAQAHTSQPGWTPVEAPSLWTDLGPA